MDGAVYASRMMNGFERDGDVVDSNCISDLLDGWVGGVIQASRDRVYGTAQYYALKMYSDHLGTTRLATEVTSPELQPGVRALDAVVTRSADGSMLFAKMSNADDTHALQVKVDLQNFAYAREVQAVVLSSAEPGERNTFAHPDAVQPQARVIRCSAMCQVELPPDSVMVLTFHKKK